MEADSKFGRVLRCFPTFCELNQVQRIGCFQRILLFVELLPFPSEGGRGEEEDLNGNGSIILSMNRSHFVNQTSGVGPVRYALCTRMYDAQYHI